ncbi:MAG: hypothetical protein KAW09_00375, partial [Thermoplasmata archaeon]|nr:hypothetical protein [Thermoplasmata archaeon]
RLMELGLSEIQTELMLTLWEAGGKLAIWGGEETNLVHELGITSSTIKRHSRELARLGFVRFLTQEKQYIISESPKRISEVVNRSLEARMRAFQQYFLAKEGEYQENRTKAHRHGVNCLDFIPTSFAMLKTAEKEARTLADFRNRRGKTKTVCGFVTGESTSRNRVKVRDFVGVGTKSGPKVHFIPIWKDFHAVKKRLISEGRLILGEFHTHPDGNPRLHEEDLRKIGHLQWGMWFIITAKHVKCYRFYTKEGELRIDNLKRV